MSRESIFVVAGTIALSVVTIIAVRLSATRNAKLALGFKRLTAAVVVVGLAATVVTEPSFYMDRPSLAVYMATPVILGVLWTLHRIESASPGRITGLVARLINPKARPGAGRQPKVVTRFTVALRGWITLAIFEDHTSWRVVHMVTLAGGFASAAWAPTPVEWVAPWALVSVSAMRWWRVQSERNKTIQRIYAIAASHLDYSRAVSSKLTQGGAQFAHPSGCISVEWQDLTNPARILVAFPVTFAKTDLAKRGVFETEFDATLPGAGWKFDWDTQATNVTITVATYPTDVRWEGRTHEHWGTFYIGDRLDDGSQVLFNVESESPHILVAGETGSGKTEAMFVIAAQALAKGWQVAICDPKETGWAMWSRRRRPTHEAGQGRGAERLRDGDARAGVIEHAVEVYGIRDVLVRMKEEMDRRKAVNAEHKVVKWSELPPEVRQEHNIVPLMVVVDEALSLFDMMKGNTEDIILENQVRGQALSMLQTLVVEARALGIHVLLGIQRPDASVLGGAMRSNLGARIACGVMEPSGYGMMFQTQGAVPRLPTSDVTGKKVIGRALVRPSPGLPIVPVQVAWLGPGQHDLNELVPLPDAPEKEDETPEGAFNPYLRFGADKGAEWISDTFGEQVAPPWERSPSTSDEAFPTGGLTGTTGGPGGEEQTAPPWEEQTAPPWEEQTAPPWDNARPEELNAALSEALASVGVVNADLDGDGTIDDDELAKALDAVYTDEGHTAPGADATSSQAWITPTPQWAFDDESGDEHVPQVPSPEEPDQELNGWFSSFLDETPPASTPADAGVHTPAPMDPRVSTSRDVDDGWWD